MKEDGYIIFLLIQIDFMFFSIIPQFLGHAMGNCVIAKEFFAEFRSKIIKGNRKARKIIKVIISRPNSFRFLRITSLPLSFY